MNRITREFLIEKGFIHRPSMIQESFEYVLQDTAKEDTWLGGMWHHYKSLSMSICNDKGEGEWYLFLREGDTEKRHEDNVVSLSRSIMWEHEVLDFLRLIE